VPGPTGGLARTGRLGRLPSDGSHRARAGRSPDGERPRQSHQERGARVSRCQMEPTGASESPSDGSQRAQGWAEARRVRPGAGSKTRVAKIARVDSRHTGNDISDVQRVAGRRRQRCINLTPAGRHPYRTPVRSGMMCAERGQAPPRRCINAPDRVDEPASNVDDLRQSVDMANHHMLRPAHQTYH
jgi:hypothetical protein